VANWIFIDLDPLREEGDFRLLFAGQLVGVLGRQWAMVAISFQVYPAVWPASPGRLP
jgi:hypothetical protein